MKFRDIPTEARENFAMDFINITIRYLNLKLSLWSKINEQPFKNISCC